LLSFFWDVGAQLAISPIPVSPTVRLAMAYRALHRAQTAAGDVPVDDDRCLVCSSDSNLYGLKCQDVKGGRSRKLFELNGNIGGNIQFLLIEKYN
jgi:hypothetical protein